MFIMMFIIMVRRQESGRMLLRGDIMVMFLSNCEKNEHKMQTKAKTKQKQQNFL